MTQIFSDKKRRAAQSTDKDFKVTRYWAAVGFFGNLVLTVIKALAGVFANSSAMIADAAHSASDVFASAFVYISLKIAQKPADKEHPYGHGNAEVISTLVVGAMLVAAGIEIIKVSLDVIRQGDIQVPGNLAVYAAVLSIGVKEIMYRFTYRAGVRTNSPSTIANALDHRSDAFSSIAALIGIAGAKLEFPVLDPVAGIVVALFIFKMSYEIIMEAVRQIMDECPGDKKIEEVRRLALDVQGVISVHGIRVRRFGAAYFVDLDLVIDHSTTLKDAHDIGEIVREMIFSRMARINEVRVHIDPSPPHEQTKGTL